MARKTARQQNSNVPQIARREYFNHAYFPPFNDSVMYRSTGLIKKLLPASYVDFYQLL
jgi:hypothetical protein